MEGFEPPRRLTRPIGFRIRTLQPLGYISINKLLLTRGNIQHNKTYVNSLQKQNRTLSKTKKECEILLNFHSKPALKQYEEVREPSQKALKEPINERLTTKTN